MCACVQVHTDKEPVSCCRFCFLEAVSSIREELCAGLKSPLPALSTKQQEQLQSWCADAEQAHLSGFKVPPSAAQQELLSPTDLLAGRNWPSEHCALPGGKQSVEQLLHAAQLRQEWAPPSYDELAKVGREVAVLCIPAMEMN